MDKKLSDKVLELAPQLSYAQTVKDVAKLRIQCELIEWELVVAEARRIYASRKPQVARVAPLRQAYRS